MKKLLLFTALVLIGAFGYACFAPSNVAYAIDPYAFFNDDFIVMYETDIAREKVVSHLSDAELAKPAAELKVSTDKLRKAMILQHAFRKAGNEYTLKEVLDMPVGEIAKNAQLLFKHLKATMSAEEYNAVELKFKTAVQKALKKK